MCCEDSSKCTNAIEGKRNEWVHHCPVWQSLSAMVLLTWFSAGKDLPKRCSHCPLNKAPSFQHQTSLIFRIPCAQVLDHHGEILSLRDSAHVFEICGRKLCFFHIQFFWPSGRETTCYNFARHGSGAQDDHPWTFQKGVAGYAGVLDIRRIPHKMSWQLKMKWFFLDLQEDFKVQ